MPVTSTDHLFARVFAPRVRHDAIVLGQIVPLAESFRQDPRLEMLEFARLNKPDWGISLHLCGEAAWLAETARPRIEDALSRLVDCGGARSWEFAAAERGDKWFGEDDVRGLLQQAHAVDSLFCLDLVAAEANGACGRSRAAVSLVLVDRLLDLLECDEAQRTGFYHRGFQWAIDLGRWDAEVMAALERKYLAQAPALRAILERRSEMDPIELWGGEKPARLAADWLGRQCRALEPALAAARDGRIASDPPALATFLAHGNANRLGVHATQEATLRYLVWRARTSPEA